MSPSGVSKRSMATTPPRPPGGADGDLVDLRRHGAVGGRSARAVLVIQWGTSDKWRRWSRPHDEGADVAAVLLHVLLDVEDAVVVGAQSFFVFQDRLGGVAVVDFGQQATPGATAGFKTTG